MKKYRRNPKATSKNYSKMYNEFNGKKYGDTSNPQYYGLFHIKGRVRVDLKRMKKIKTSGIPDKILDAASRIPRNTTYYHPTRIKRSDYVCNQFRDLFTTLETKWHEIKKAFDKIINPGEVAEHTRLSAIMNSGLENEDATVEGLLAGFKRLTPYYELYIAMHANFIHHIASETLALMFRKACEYGYKGNELGRASFRDFFEKKATASKKIDELSHYQNYTAFFIVWNLLKHNSIKAFQNIKQARPELLLKSTYKNGELSQYILRIDDAFIESSLSDLSLFFDEFCTTFLNENTERATWDYDEYFEQRVFQTIKELNNPFDTLL